MSIGRIHRTNSEKNPDKQPPLYIYISHSCGGLLSCNSILVVDCINPDTIAAMLEIETVHNVLEILANLGFTASFVKI